eukprot:338656-Rhodomonas_salina.1
MEKRRRGGEEKKRKGCRGAWGELEQGRDSREEKTGGQRSRWERRGGSKAGSKDGRGRDLPRTWQEMRVRVGEPTATKRM